MFLSAKRLGGWVMLAGLVGCLASGKVAWAQAGGAPGPVPQQTQNPNAPSSDDGHEILTRGPVHEAFAEPVVFDHQQGVVVPKEPPQQVEELPPVEKPEGDVIWIPGYWNWDDERQDFVWVSGIWRNAPPNMRWVPGYWNRVGNGYQWTSGFWQSAASEDVEYLPQPPTSLENGPPTPQPSDNHFWVPGNWSWQSNRYAWRAGYWSVNQPDWVWHPASYYWTPSGYAFVDGYWDYPLASRGLLFAPAYFPPAYVARRPIYTPSVVIETPGLMLNFFARPRYRHYYFGDYYAPLYVERGYRPWFRYDRISYRYDPLYTYYHGYYARSDRMWRARMVERYDRLVVDANLRPARIYPGTPAGFGRTMGVRGGNVRPAQGVVLGRPISQVAVGGSIRFERLNDQQRRQTAAVSVQVSKFRDERARLEGTPNLARVTGAQGARPASVRLTGSPIVDPGVRVAGGAAANGRVGEKGATGTMPGVSQPRRGDAIGAIARPREGKATADAGRGETKPINRVPGVGNPNTGNQPGTRPGVVGNNPPTTTKPGAVGRIGMPSNVKPQPGAPGATDRPLRPGVNPAPGNRQPGGDTTPSNRVRPGNQPPTMRPQPAQPGGQVRPDRRTPPAPPKANEKGRVGDSSPVVPRLSPAVTSGRDLQPGTRTGSRPDVGSSAGGSRNRSYSSGEIRPAGASNSSRGSVQPGSAYPRGGRSAPGESRSRSSPNRNSDNSRDRNGRG